MGQGNTRFQVLGYGKPGAFFIQTPAMLEIVSPCQYVQTRKRTVQQRNHLFCHVIVIDSDHHQARVTHTQALQKIRLPRIPVEHGPARFAFPLDEAGVDINSKATLAGTLWGSGYWANPTDSNGLGTVDTGTVNIWGDPDFIDPDIGNYHINTDSAAIDTGVDGGVTEDMDGNERPQNKGYDIGADEYSAGLKVRQGASGPVHSNGIVD